MAGTFTAKQPAPVDESLHDIPVADFGTLEINTLLPERQLNAQIGHQGAHNAPFQGSGGMTLRGDHVEQLVAIDFRAVTIHHEHPVTVAIKGDPEISLLLQNGLAQ